MRESITSLVASLFPELGSSLVEVVLDSWKEVTVGIVVDESAAKVAERLKQNRSKMPLTIAAVLGIGGSLQIRSAIRAPTTAVRGSG